MWKDGEHGHYLGDRGEEKPFQFPLRNPSWGPGVALASGVQMHGSFSLSLPMTSLITIWILLSLKAAGHPGNQKSCQLDSIQVPWPGRTHPSVLKYSTDNSRGVEASTGKWIANRLPYLSSNLDNI